MFRSAGRAALAANVVLCCWSAMAAAQVGRVYTAADYAQAEKFMDYNVNPLVYHTVKDPQWLADGRLWYRDAGPDGATFMLVDPAKRTKVAAFDHVKVAAALNSARGSGLLSISARTPLDAVHLPIDDLKFEDADHVVLLRFGLQMVRCDLRGQGECKAAANVLEETYDVSPDGKKAAFIRDNNLWAREVASGHETQLTRDGVLDYGYATDNAGWTHSDKPVVAWSPDSKKIATFQQDQRKTGSMYLVPVTNRHPVLKAWKYPLVGDKDVTTIERVVIDVDAAKVTRLKMPPDQHRSTECDDISCRGGSGWDDVEWSPDGRHLAFVSTSRDHKDEWLRVADPATGDVREVFHEHVDTYYGWQSKVNWKYLAGSNEFLWVSERSDWAQLYLYDLTTGKLKNQITHGDGPIADVVNVDEKNRVIYFMATGKERGEDPYFDNYYRVDFDGKNQQLLTPEVADHVVTAARDGSVAVDIYSTVQTPQIAVLRDNSGKVLMTLAAEDISKLTATGWKAPEPITVKARDDETPLYGFVWKPTTFDATKKYPVVDFVYPGPQGSGCPARTFSAATRDNQALAELGFIVVCIDGMGNPHRTKAFHDAYASKPEDMGDDTIPDQVSGIKELASRSPWIDLDRVGIWGHSGGGNATVSAMFHFPDFFKVGIAESGNHDNRDYEDDWDERWAGLEVIGPDGKSNYDSHANQNYAKNLKGHLLLMHGTMDDNVPPNNTLLVVDALIKANKDFDLIMIPNARHGYGAASPYITRRRWDYFVRYLAGGVPPVDYQMKPWAQQRAALALGPSDDDTQP
jgi:dipeptidyl aminopeptidase/acylaminoacyl peptidase